MNTTIILIVILGVGAVLLALKAIQYNSEDKEPKATPKPKKSVKLFSQDGNLLYEYRDVYLTHWDDTIYLLSYEHDGKTFMRIDKGVDMLLMVESYISTSDN